MPLKEGKSDGIKEETLMGKGTLKSGVALAALIIGLLAMPAVVFVNAAVGIALLAFAVYLIFAAS